MYGTISRFNVKPGKTQAVIDLFDEWGREFRPKVQGATTGYLYQPDSNADELIMVVGFSDRDSYRANAQSPAQDEWYQRLRENLTRDPEWEDGSVVGNWD